MGFKDRWAEIDADGDACCDEPTSSAYKANSALSTLYASDYGYEDWKNIGIAFKAAGGELSDWLAWCSIDASRYDEKVAAQLFNSVSPDGPITANSLWKRAWEAGWEWHERFDKLPKVRRVPKPREFTSADEQAIAQLTAMFEPGEHVNIVTRASKNKHGKWVPSGYGRQYVCAALCDAIRERGLEAALGGYNHEAGAWLRVNPTDGRGIDDANVTAHRNALVESDDMPLKDQERMFFEMNLPMACVTNSGGKSLHAVVRVDADGPNHFKDRVRYLHGECEKSGLIIDKANKNPGRLTRLAGVMRGGNEQTLMHVGKGARDFATWMAQENSAKLVYDYGIEPMDMENVPVLDEVLIDGVMRRGDKMCVAGPSKAYKSFALIQLAIAVACGTRWLGWQCKQGRVLYINCELRGESFRKRVWEVAGKMRGADRQTIAANMDVWNMRGRTQPLRTGKEHIIEQAESRGYDVIVLDPVYKLFAGDENSAEEVSAFMLLIDELSSRTRASVAYCHHHSKGAKGGVSAQDRFSGSGVFARDCDELVDISPLDLKDRSIAEFGFEPTATAWRVETVIRDFAPKPPLDVVFEYPLHHVDETGYLEGFSILSPQSVGGSKRGEQMKERRDENAAKLAKFCADYYSDYDEPLTAVSLAKHFGVEKKTIIAWANNAEGIRVVKVGNVNTVMLM
ncbi:MAG: AAA family ATPase [Bacteroidales bacterium]|nr:AAA family ATPase [Bacteroidales bacterium]